MTIKTKVTKLTPGEIEKCEKILGSPLKKRREVKELARLQTEQINQVKKLREKKK